MRSTPVLPAEERWMGMLLAVLVAGPAWLRGGTHAESMRMWLPVAVLVLIALLVLSWRHGAPASGKAGWAGLISHLRDPVFWSGLLLISLLATQWWNSGRELFFDAGTQQWAYSPPRHAFLPSAINAGGARQMIEWFFPAWVIILALRSPVMSCGAVRLLWRLLVYNAGILALFGVVQYAAGTSLMYGRIPMKTHFFASFGYPNHAGSYFLMIAPLAVGLLSREISSGKSIRWGRTGALGVAFLLGIVGANLSLSRSAIAFSWGLTILLGVLLLASFWPRMEAAQRVNALASGLAVLCLSVLLTLGLGREAIRREFKPEADRKTLLERELDLRVFQLRTAAHIWREDPWFGVGGWGYRYLLAHHLPPSEWRRITPGKANVHNDALQFLAEFGIVGAGAMAVIALLLILAVVRARTGWPPVVLFPLLGAGLVCLQSLIDLPFRSPAVLYMWLVCVAGASRVISPARRQTDGPDEHIAAC